MSTERKERFRVGMALIPLKLTGLAGTRASLRGVTVLQDHESLIS